MSIYECVVCLDFAFERTECSHGHTICKKCLDRYVSVMPFRVTKDKGVKCSLNCSGVIRKFTGGYKYKGPDVSVNNTSPFIGKHIDHITNHILCRHCPWCNAVYGEYTHCPHVTCNRCKECFCALCLEPQNGYHECIYKCDGGFTLSHKRKLTQYYINVDTASRLEKYINRISPLIRKRVVGHIRKICEDRFKIDVEIAGGALFCIYWTRHKVSLINSEKPKPSELAIS